LAVQLPEGEDTNEWLAVHGESVRPALVCASFDVFEAVDFFNHLNMLYGTITEFCTPNEVRASVSSSYLFI
jgi:MOB kinase activator 1